MKNIKVNTDALYGALRKRQTDMAKALGVTQPTLSRWLTGRNRIRIETVNDIANFLGKDATDFIEIIEG